MPSIPVVSSSSLNEDERKFVAALSDLNFGRIERLSVRNGKLVLSPWPRTIQLVKLGSCEPAQRLPSSNAFDLKKQVVDFFALVRSFESAEILHLQVRHGLPFDLEVEMEPQLSAPIEPE